MSELQASVPPPSKGATRTRRFVLSLVTVAATIYLGITLGTYLALAVADCKIKDVAGIPVEWGLTAVGIAYVLASLEKVLKVANTFRDYIVNPDKKVSLYPDCVALACIVAYLTLVSVAFAASAQCRKAPPETPSLPVKELVFLSRVAPPGSQPLELVPFFFADLAVGDADPTRGTTLSPQQTEDLRRLVRSLKACVGTSTGQDVELDFRGYADSNQFPKDSVEQNRKTANRRAASLHRAVKDLLGTQTGASQVVLHGPKEWPEDDPLAMTRENYFETRPLKNKGDEQDQGLFNRRADLLVLRLGACERMKPQAG